MKLLLDECMDRHLARSLKNHFVRTVPQMGWASFKNGELLALAQNQFDVFITVDRHLPNQQHLAKFKIAVLVIRTTSNRLADLKPLLPAILAAIERTKPGHAIFVGA
ncbi:MAG: DUF5615 family PIN-like protein [Elusimicrobia bacterium]|nr:DUF5615 family PIN-like protein [Candidatus Obscuribacterium magneticum]